MQCEFGQTCAGGPLDADSAYCWNRMEHCDYGGRLLLGGCQFSVRTQHELESCAIVAAWIPTAEANCCAYNRGGADAMPTDLDFISAAGSELIEAARRPLEASQCAVVVIDIQEKLLSPIFQKELLIRNSQLLVRAAGILKIPTIATTQYSKGLGNTVPEIQALLSDPGIDKQVFSCFGSDVFCSMLKRLPGRRTTILLCGMESHICVMQTALGALREGYL